MKLTDTIRRERNELAIRFIESGGKLPWLETLRLTALVALGGEFADTVKQAMFVAAAKAGVVLEWSGPSSAVGDMQSAEHLETGLAFVIIRGPVQWLLTHNKAARSAQGLQRFDAFDTEFLAKVRAIKIVHEMSKEEAR